MTRSFLLSPLWKSLTLFLIFIAGLASILATSDSGNVTTTVACTGAGQNVRTGSVVILDARCSDFTEAATDRAMMDYRWQLVSKPAESATVLIAFRPISQFVADVDGEYLLELATTASGGTDSSTYYRVIATTGNAQPRVEGGSYQEVAVGDSVSLMASGSDADSDGLSYQWVFNPASASETLTTPTTSAAGFVANQEEDYLVDVMVSDGAADSPADTVLIRSKNTNLSLPVAVAGGDQFVTPGTQVNLDGSGSYSAYARPLSYSWRMLSRPGPSDAVLFTTTEAQTSFIADIQGHYIIRLRVNDGINDSSRSIDGVFEDRLVVTARANQLPVADGGVDHSVNTGEQVNLDASASSDPELATLTYGWSIHQQPAGSTATLSSTDTMATNFTPDRDGDYLLRLVVNDGSDDSLPDIVRVSASSLVGGATALTVATGLPYAPAAAEVATLFLVDTDSSDTLAFAGSDESVPLNFEAAMQAQYNSGDAEFVAMNGWSVIAPANLTIGDATTPTFILQRPADGMYYKLVFDFTVLGNLTVQIDSVTEAWRCGSSPVNCP